MVYRFAREPRGNTYRRLLAFAQRTCDAFLLVTRHTIETGERMRALLDELQPYLLGSRETSELPATRLLEDTALVSTYAFTPQTSRLLASAASALYEWQQPELPEDLSLCRPGGYPWLVTESHERLGFLHLDASEKSALSAAIPRLRLRPGPPRVGHVP